MFVILTNENQTILSSFRLFLCFATNSPVAEKSTLVLLKWPCLHVRHGTVFQGCLASLLQPQMDSFPFSQFEIGSLPVRGIFFCFDFE